MFAEWQAVGPCQGISNQKTVTHPEMLCVPCVGHTNTHTVLCKGAAYPLLLRPKGNWLLKHSLEALTLEKLGDSAQRSATQILETVV